MSTFIDDLQLSKILLALQFENPLNIRTIAEWNRNSVVPLQSKKINLGQVNFRLKLYQQQFSRSIRPISEKKNEQSQVLLQTEKMYRLI